MKKRILIGLCTGIFIACQPEGQLPVQVGQFTTISQTGEYLDVDKITNVKDFDLAYQEKSKNNGRFRFLLPYDFDKKIIANNQQAKTGIPIMGTPYECLVYCCLNSDVLIEVASNQAHSIEFEPLDKTSLKKWIALQILNNGQDPALSDIPQQAIFRLMFDEQQPFSDANLLLYQITDTYEEFLKERATVERLDIKQIKEKYPLNLRFATKPPPLQPIECPVEIFEEIDLNIEINE